MRRRKILILIGRYLPGYKDGGPVRSIKNLTDALGDEYEFRILTCDRDHGDTKPYPDICVNGWNHVGKAEVYYVPPGGFKMKLIRALARKADVVYVCGCFNDYAIHTLLLKRFGLIDRPVAVAAMGLFSPLEFARKRKKKQLYVSIFNALGFFRRIYWSATSEIEVNDILQHVKTERQRCMIAEDLPRLVSSGKIIKQKEKGCLKVVWISRIAEIKNLEEVIEVLGEVSGTIDFTVYGPVQDTAYWERCRRKLKALPDHVHWSYKGNVDSERVVDTLKAYHVFFFLTKGENFGHVIQEALSAGCPAVISDRTPWRDFEKYGVGYVVSLADRKRMKEVLEYYTWMANDEYGKISAMAHEYAVKVSNHKAAESGYRQIFALDS
ncbi:MAG: glycosyltransferase family 4 protein [Lachnospiraceae bacterium]|nr:glycosyltransferase family 4 protein [Lachnospiraceae bacterium]